ncbi:endonuclease domain-containing protein [Sphingorhabdus sp. M41]|uniref:endonuclease domain-containing protein n=1 Tax=Sphingorhabdus sp. M41 TaxID=1806885 RepID=UPI00078B9110|nr:DUF559 domain-containing protein [Sphingorhabdus sp. M41]AMO71950.1 hypothetical protein AZE99_08910 [Sphingorhabdus sp. M41]
MKRVPEKLTRNARNLRKNATPAERRLWDILCRYRPRFTRQLPIPPYIVDFAHRKAKIVIELDGSQHLDSKKKDLVRTEYLVKRGWKELRFWNNEVMENTEGVAELILNTVSERLGGKRPEALPPRKRKPKPE